MTSSVRVRSKINLRFQGLGRPHGKARGGRIAGYLANEQRSHAGWIGSSKCEVILERALSIRSWCKAVLYSPLFILALAIFPVILYGEEDRNQETMTFETGLYYTIGEGDTLWDLSNQFYDLPYLWPDLWQKNEYIPNPHWIYPGNRIRLYERIEQGVATPEMEEKPRRSITYDLVDRTGFIREKAVRGRGEVISSAKHKNLLSSGDKLYVHGYEGEEFYVGEKFFVFRTFDPLKHPVDGYEVGIQHFILGVVVVTEVLPDMVTVNVVESYREIHVTDLLMPYRKRSPEIKIVDAVSGLEGRIVSADNLHRLNAFCEGMVAFIDKGENDGVRIGQPYDIYIQDKETFYDRHTKNVFPPPVVTGQLLILHTEKTTATALITRVSRDISMGDKIHAAPSPTDMASSQQE